MILGQLNCRLNEPTATCANSAPLAVLSAGFQYKLGTSMATDASNVSVQHSCALVMARILDRGFETNNMYAWKFESSNLIQVFTI